MTMKCRECWGILMIWKSNGVYSKCLGISRINNLSIRLDNLKKFYHQNIRVFNKDKASRKYSNLFLNSSLILPVNKMSKKDRNKGYKVISHLDMIKTNRVIKRNKLIKRAHNLNRANKFRYNKTTNNSLNIYNIK